ncbi:hypothetical protein [Pleurocapsa sp. FMAR1]|uniref:hypothetical protein n=1 Tax=Pleurocapsa sp. FMAR1 TaxID=3040204 RepID=UPI0029C97077|nr:hypothetical protein [Pleurocapsa sp. FMAR1]
MNIFKKSCIFCLSILFICFSWSIPVEGGVLGVLSNKEWTISVGNEQSFTGRNGTGNLSYYGCDQKCNCINLTGGKMICRNGICETGWQNKNFTYVYSFPITTSDDSSPTPPTLKILSNYKIIYQGQLYPKAFDNVDSGN